MLTETSFVRCYVNGKKSGLASYSDNSARVLYFSQSLGEGVGVADLQAAGVSLHQFNNSIVIPSADVAGVVAALPGAVVELAGSPEYDARVKSAVGSRGGSASSASAGSASSAPSAPAVGASAAAELPAVDASEILNTALSSAVGGLAPMVAGAILPAVNSWASGLVDEVRAAAVPECKESVIRVIDASGVERAKVSGMAHKELQKVVNLLSLNLNVYLFGPAGTGKTVLCSQAAAALGLSFFSDQRVGDTFTLSGFVDASGKYQETAFYQAFSRGGLYMLDEFDASDPNAVIWLNTALANGFATFPGVGRVDAHKDFKCIAAGNTIGRGADSDYSGRCVLDAATLSRFAFVSVGYDPEIEKSVGGDELAAFIQDVRRACASCGVSLVAGTRELKAIAKCAAAGCFTDTENLEMNLIRAVETDQIKLIVGALSVRGRWADALKKLAA